MQKRRQEKIRLMTQEKKIALYKKLQSDLIVVSEEIDDFKRSVRSQEEVIAYFRSIAPFDRESVFVLYLDAKNRVIDYKEEFQGTLTQSIMYPREIIKQAMKKAAFSIIVCHNHPSGDVTPSVMERFL